ncbi:sigma factor-like helix-turn-helix DNA-binding protein [Nitratifractor salsuginis]|uniref:sigma factor-like helix-turn-helix DNA-binding protein n=1 Tax=Nitratifractor salsuginis TaxID=269261 RepID=UPI000301629E|nr:sigma factor-like helix-turn-helix DNA-binding protein [Nitratifractor salsuginis]
MQRAQFKNPKENPVRYQGYSEMSLEEIATILGLSRERVRQIELQAIRKLRAPLISKKLREYLDE